MAIAPLFVADIATLRAALRLSGVVNTDGDAAIDNAVETVRIGFFDHLGASRVTEIGAISYSENATTAEAIVRTKANQCEVKWTRLHLLRTLPVLFLDGSAEERLAWNEEGLTRNANQAELNDEIERLTTEIMQLLCDLEGDEEPSGQKQVQGGTIERSTPAPRPGSSIFGRRW